MLFYNKKILLIVTFFSIQESCCSEILKKYLTKNNVLLGTSMVALTYFAYKYFNKKNPPKNNHNKEDGLKQSPPKSPEEEKTSEAIPKFSPEKLNTNEKKPEASSECPSSELEKKDFKEEIFVKKNKNQTMITEKTTWKDLGITEQINNSDKELQARFFKKIENQLIERIEDTYPTKTPSIMSKQPDDSIEKFSRYLFNDFKKIIEAYNCINISYQENESIKNSSDLYYFIENKLFDALGNIALPCLDRYGQAINITPLETVNKTFNEFRKLVNKKNESSDKYETILAHCTIEKDAAKTSSMTQNEKEFIGSSTFNCSGNWRNGTVKI